MFKNLAAGVLMLYYWQSKKTLVATAENPPGHKVKTYARLRLVFSPYFSNSRSGIAINPICRRENLSNGIFFPDTGLAQASLPVPCTYLT